MTKININGIQRDMTPEEQAEYDALQIKSANNLASEKLKEIKKIRLQKLQETDYLACSDMTMPSDVATWRQAMRDITDNYSESDYDDLLNHDGTNLTHPIWSK
jgi:hypothetical protein